MTDRTGTRNELSSDELGRALRRLADEHAEVSSDKNDATFARIEQRRAPALQIVQKRRLSRAYVAAAGGVAAAALLAWLSSSPGLREVVFGSEASEGASLSFSVDGSKEQGLDSQGRVVASESDSVIIRFTDASTMKLSPHSTLRIAQHDSTAEQLDAKGTARDATSAPRRDTPQARGGEETTAVVARLAQGEVDVSLDEEESASYLFEAGQYRLTGVGSSFVFAYVPTTRVLDVRAARGTVIVEGLSVDGGGVGRHEVRAGEHLILPKTAVKGVSTKGGEGRVDDAVASSGALPLTGIAPGEGAGSGERKASSGGVGYQDLAKAGRFSDIVALAEKEGITSVLNARSAGDLQQLGQAARYVGNPSLAERVWLSMVTRFSGSVEGRNAQFFLGRLYDEQGRTGEALARYDAYLSQAGAGVYTMDALGRKLLVVKKTRGASGARPIAQEYLRRFPQGPYAKAARELAGGE